MFLGSFIAMLLFVVAMIVGLCSPCISVVPWATYSGYGWGVSSLVRATARLIKERRFSAAADAVITSAMAAATAACSKALLGL